MPQPNIFGEEFPISGEHQDRVEEVLREVPLARQNDKILVAEVWQRYGVEIDVDALKGPSIPSSETITRMRRKLQANGYYKSNSAVAEARAEKQESFRKNV